MSTLTGYQDQLAAQETRLRSKAVRYVSLAPHRETPTPLSHLLVRLTPILCGEESVRAFVHGLIEITESMLHHYPDNIFWDLDRMAVALAAAGSPRGMRLMSATITDLQQGYGTHSIIAFRYVHDFTYGFDWCRWVKKDMRHRAAIGPFDWPYLCYLQKRRRELEALIAQNDEKYHQFAPGAARNPFVFSREPDDEYRLFIALAYTGHIPVPTWSMSEACIYDKPFDQLRVEMADALQGVSMSRCAPLAQPMSPLCASYA